jgi:hypothetical protein
MDHVEVDRLLLRQDKEFGLVVVDLAKDPLVAGPLARSSTRNSNLDKALLYFFGLIRSMATRSPGKVTKTRDNIPISQ